jgi:hypothetical protein
MILRMKAQVGVDASSGRALMHTADVTSVALESKTQCAMIRRLNRGSLNDVMCANRITNCASS